jgi:hypothetical protein
MPQTQFGKIVHLAEECAEVVQACTKVMRFGLYEYHPETQVSNHTKLIEELADLKSAIALVEEAIR